MFQVSMRTLRPLTLKVVLEDCGGSVANDFPSRVPNRAKSQRTEGIEALRGDFTCFRSGWGVSLDAV